MKNFKLLFFVIINVILVSCKSTLKDIEKNKIGETTSDVEQQLIKIDTLLGMYVGDFGGSDIRIVLNFISENHAVGYNIHKGLQRNISGKVFQSETEINLELHEPGDHQYDGVFYLKFDKNTLVCSGYWKSNSKKIGKKNFTLEKVENNSTSFDLENLKLDDVTKNNFSTIFAYCSDSLGDLFFENDGFCKYEFYPKIDTNERVEQIVSVKGSWTFTNDKKIKINWLKNTNYKHSNEVFDIVFGKENYDFYLFNENHKFYPNFFGY